MVRQDQDHTLSPLCRPCHSSNSSKWWPSSSSSLWCNQWDSLWCSLWWLIQRQGSRWWRRPDNRWCSSRSWLTQQQDSQCRCSLRWWWLLQGNNRWSLCKRPRLYTMELPTLLSTGLITPSPSNVSSVGTMAWLMSMKRKVLLLGFSAWSCALLAAGSDVVLSPSVSHPAMTNNTNASTAKRQSDFASLCDRSAPTFKKRSF